MTHSISIALYALTPQGVQLGTTLMTKVAEEQLFFSRAPFVYGKTTGIGAFTFFIPQRFLAEYIPPENTATCTVQVQGFDSLTELVQQQFSQNFAHIFIAATGIVVRSLAPLLQHKSKDPAVLVCDQQGEFVISLLSGHLGGANLLAHHVATVLKAAPVITTASDVAGLPAFDVLAQENGLHIANALFVKYVQATLLQGKPVLVEDPCNCLELRGSVWEHLFVFTPLQQNQQAQQAQQSTGIVQEKYCTPEVVEQLFIKLAEDITNDMAPDMNIPAVVVSPFKKPASQQRPVLWLHPQCVTVGLGCRKDSEPEAVMEAVRTALAQTGIAKEAIRCFASVDIKAAEAGLIESAKHFSVPFVTFSATELATVAVPNPSRKAAEVLDVSQIGVAEGAALYAAGANGGTGANGYLLLEKMTIDGVTIALAISV